MTLAVLREMITSSLRLRLWRARLRHPTCTIYATDIGRDVQLGRHCRVEQGVVLSRGVALGDYSYVNRGTLIGSGKIGKFCSVGPGCQIGPAEHPLHHASTSPYIYGSSNIIHKDSHWEDFSSAPQIGNDVWIGGLVIVLQGVTIGDGAVLAAGTVITRDVAPYAVVVGVPGRVIKYRFPPEQVEYLLQLRWWDLPLAQLRALAPSLFADEDWPVRMGLSASAAVRAVRPEVSEEPCPQ